MTPVSAPELVVCAVALLARNSEEAIRQYTTNREGFGQSSIESPEDSIRTSRLGRVYHNAPWVLQPVLKQRLSFNIPVPQRAISCRLCVRDRQHVVVTEPFPEYTACRRDSTFEGETEMAQRHQRGWLKKETRTQGEMWVLFFRTTRKADRKRVENKIPIGLVKDFPEMSDARTEVERLHLRINAVNSRRGV